MNYLVADYYHWNAFSQVRSVWEYLESLGFKCIFLKNFRIQNIEGNSSLLIYTSKLILSEEDYNLLKSRNVKVVTFGLSDPHMYIKSRHSNCNIYCSNNYALPNSYYYPSVCDARYHKHLGLKKNIDLIFIGTGRHPVVKNRIAIVNKLRENSFHIKVFGKRWRIKHEDNHGFLEGDIKTQYINRAKIYLDLSNENASLGHRIFESSCCGTPVLTFRRKDVEYLFSKDEMLFYDNYDHLFEILPGLLSNENRLLEIGMNARKKCLAEYDVTQLIPKLLNDLGIPVDKKTK